MSNVILGNNFYFGSLFLEPHGLFQTWAEYNKKMAKFTSQINFKLTLVTMRNVLSSTIFAINLTCKLK
jgi:hypothetical protein